MNNIKITEYDKKLLLAIKTAIEFLQITNMPQKIVDKQNKIVIIVKKLKTKHKK